MENPILVISFSVNPEAEAAFNSFYHRSFLPHLLSQSPEIVNVRRYEEFGTGGSLRWYNKQFLTIYQLAGSETIDKLNDIFERETVVDVVKEFRQWKEKSLRNFARISFANTWAHPRRSAGGAFAGRPFFLWQLEMKPQLDREFQDWYEQQYLPFQIAEIPTWSGALRYQSLDRETVRHLTFFQAETEGSLKRCLSDLRSAHRIEPNLEWQKRVDAAVTWQDATSFRPIFRWPD